MHPATCSCANCGQNEYELYGAFELGETLSETEELELAMELLSVQQEEELEQFLGNLMKGVGHGLSSVGKFVGKNVLPIVGPTLKQLAKTALPLAGGALGSLIPIPGVGTMIGRTLGQAAANALEMETIGMDPESADIEKARRFVKIAASAIADASQQLGGRAITPGSAPAQQVALKAITNATRRYLPGMTSSFQQQFPAQNAANVSRSGFSRAGHSGSGTWRREGNALIIEGV